MSYFSPRNILETLTQPSFVLPTLFSLLPPYAIALLGIGTSLVHDFIEPKEKEIESAAVSTDLLDNSDLSPFSVMLPLALALNSLPTAVASLNCAMFGATFGLSEQDPSYYLQIDLLWNASFADSPGQLTQLYKILGKVNVTCPNLIPMPVLAPAILINSGSLEHCTIKGYCPLGDYREYSRDGSPIDAFAQKAFACLTSQLMSPKTHPCPNPQYDSPEALIICESILAAGILFLVCLVCCSRNQRKDPLNTNNADLSQALLSAADVPVPTTQSAETAIVLGKMEIQPLAMNLLDAKPGNLDL